MEPTNAFYLNRTNFVKCGILIELSNKNRLRIEAHFYVYGTEIIAFKNYEKNKDVQDILQ